jgi:hypothetical protein
MVKLVGSADNEVCGALADFLGHVDEEARAHHSREVTVDLREVEFMNSSGLQAFVAWIGRVRDLDASLQYRIVLLTDEAISWQRRSCRTLAMFASQLVRIES